MNKREMKTKVVNELKEWLKRVWHIDMSKYRIDEVTYVSYYHAYCP